MPAATEVSMDFFDNSLVKPLWANDTFQLLKASELNDFLFIGNGWYKAEYKENADTMSLPSHRSFRWLSTAGEIYMIHNAQANSSYTLTFNVSPSEYLNYKRKIQIWHNDQLIDVQEVTGTARMTSKPFTPTQLNKIVIRIPEKPGREFGGTRWLNNNVFQSGLRLVNVSLSHVRVSPVNNPKQDSAPQLLATAPKGD